MNGTKARRISLALPQAKDGAVEWISYSKNGEVISNQLMLASVSDGVNVFFGFRHV